MLRKFFIENFRIGGSRTFIIAEGGVNHNGNIDIAKELIDEAVKARVDAIKFQTFITEDLVTKYAPKAEYQKIKSNKGESQFEMIKKLELSFDAFRELKKYADDKKILFLSTPFDFKSVEFLIKLGVSAFKIGSGDMNNILMLEQITKIKKPILLSTGMATLDEISETYNFLLQNGVTKLLLFHCVTDYPAPFNALNIKFITNLDRKFNIPIGFSDHSTGIAIPQLAVAAGATAIEKHFTLDKDLPGPDHKASIIPEELKSMVETIRFTEKAIGSLDKDITEIEKQNRIVARKSIVAIRDIPENTILSKKDIGVKRPGDGLSPMVLPQIIGKRTKTKIDKDRQILWEFLEK